MYRVFHKAICTNCGHVASTHNNTDFLDPFFLPRHCEGCGEYRSSSSWPYENKDYEIVTIKQKRIKHTFHMMKPATWFARWEDVMQEEPTND